MVGEGCAEGGRGSVDQGVGFFDGFDDLSDLEGLFEEGIEALLAEPGGLAVGEFAAHGDDASHGEVVVGVDEGRDLA